MKDERSVDGLGLSRDEWAEAIAGSALVSIPRLMARNTRVVVIAAHPGDEVLGTGGLIAMLALSGYSVSAMVVSDGESSHPASKRWTREHLRRTRPQESDVALGRLLRMERKRVPVLRGGFPDGGLSAEQAPITQWIRGQIGAGDLVLAPFALDGRPDHEAVSGAARTAAQAVQAGFGQIVLWASHWARPGHLQFPWERLHRVLLPAFIVDRKRNATRALVSQIEPDETTGRAAVLAPQVLSRFLLPTEWLIL